MRYLGLLLALTSLCTGFQKNSRQPKPPEVVVLEMTCRRADGDLTIDGRVKIQAEKPVRGLRLLFDFLGSDRQLLQTKRGEVESEMLDPGTETEFHLRVADHARAVLFSVRAEDKGARDLRIEPAGPYPIE